jgi:cell division protein FtsI (penicillin-binding protein 3)
MISYQNKQTHTNWRRRFVLGVMMISMSGLVLRAGWMQYNQDPRLVNQLNRQHLEVVQQNVARGRIFDRRGEILASSAPIRSIGIDLTLFKVSQQSLQVLGQRLQIPATKIQQIINDSKSSRYVPIKHRVSPLEAQQVADLGLNGLVIDRHYDRYYPAGAASAQLIGFVGNSGHGQSGVERIFDQQLQSTSGSYSVIRDRKRHKLEGINQLKQAESGEDITLSIDQRLQYTAYSELKTALIKHQAKAAAFVMLDARTGEILVMVNLPDFNPNNRQDRDPERYRNRAATDLFEPGSTIKPFTIGCALQSGIVTPYTKFDTAPGYMRVGRHSVRDTHNYKILDTSGVLRKSSNVGTTKIALELEPKTLWGCFHQAQFDQKSSIPFPGVVPGYLPAYQGWGQFEQATHAFGYGLNTSLLQLAHAYTALANKGKAAQLSVLKQDKARSYTRVFSAQVADQILAMMEAVVSTEGTARRAKISGYRVAGKTGTVQKITEQGYSHEHHLGLFVGIAPASNPRFVAAVLIDDPQQDGYYGGVVAAPVFANVMKQALRLYAIAPDKETDEIIRVTYSVASNDYVSE